MKALKLTSLTLFLGMASHVMGQGVSTSTDEYECIYEYQVKNSKGSSDATSTILQIGRNTAMFSDYTAFKKDSAIACKAPESDIQKFKTQEMRNDMFFDQSVSQNEPKGKMTIYSVITPNYYSYTEAASPINWTFADEEDTICGYTCQKAMGEYGVELGWFGTLPRYLYSLVLGNFAVCLAWCWLRKIRKAYISSRRLLSVSPIRL